MITRQSQKKRKKKEKKERKGQQKVILLKQKKKLYQYVAPIVDFFPAINTHHQHRAIIPFLFLLLFRLFIYFFLKKTNIYIQITSLIFVLYPQVRPLRNRKL
jgi:hypothetical protein